jgi:transglutaminase-like putative cysteine protease
MTHTITAAPSRASRVPLVLAVCVAALLHTAITGSLVLGAICVATALASLARRSGARLSTPMQSMLLALCGVLGATLVPLLPVVDGVGERELRRAYPALAASALLLAALRTHLRHADWGAPGTLAVALVVLLACGSVRSGPVYPALVFAYVALACLALRADRNATPLAALPARHASVAMLCFCVAIVASLAAAHVLPAVYLRADALMLRLMKRHAAGFHDGTIALGGLEGLLQSDAIVLRAEGLAGERLRGNVYADYDDGRWRGRRRSVPPPGLASRGTAPPPPELEELRLVDVIPERVARTARLRFAGRKLDRFFLPATASFVSLEPPDVEVDAYGIVRLPARERPAEATLGFGATPRLSVAPPARADLALPSRIEARLRDHARDFTAGAASAPEKIDRIRSRLESGYVYALRVTPDASADDPILSFLETHRQGHCEYFATAAVLLARAAGIPARLVTGFRVMEHNPLGGYYIVRERHAHAWAEIYLPGETASGWVAVDPRPVRTLEPEPPLTTPWLRGATDAAWIWTRDNARTLLLAGLGVTFVGIQIARLLRSQRGRHRLAGMPRAPTPAYVRDLFTRLGSLGHVRPHHESLEDFAVRLERVTPSVGDGPREPGTAHALCDAAELVGRYAALRYGAHGDAHALERDVRRWIDAHGGP